jgi:hypothetical protein
MHNRFKARRPSCLHEPAQNEAFMTICTTKTCFDMKGVFLRRRHRAFAFNTAKLLHHHSRFEGTAAAWGDCQHLPDQTSFRGRCVAIIEYNKRGLSVNTRRRGSKQDGASSDWSECQDLSAARLFTFDRICILEDVESSHLIQLHQNNIELSTSRHRTPPLKPDTPLLSSATNNGTSITKTQVGSIG